MARTPEPATSRGWRTYGRGRNAVDPRAHQRRTEPPPPWLGSRRSPEYELSGVQPRSPPRHRGEDRSRLEAGACDSWSLRRGLRRAVTYGFRNGGTVERWN